MKLNPNCIRAILLAVEDDCDFNNPWVYDKHASLAGIIAEYEHEEIIYHIKQAHKSNLIEGVGYYDDGNLIYIDDLTPTGHEFLANIRKNSTWQTIIKNAASMSLPVLIDLAKSIAMKQFL